MANLTKYEVKVLDALGHFVEMSAVITNPNKDVVAIQLPAWRPGRYELANYAKNIRKFKVQSKTGDAINYRKISKDCWQIESVDIEEFYIRYEYYANQPDAGASYVDEKLLYLNPVNCFMYVVGRLDDAFELNLNIPHSWQIACQLPIKGSTLYAQSFDELADSPFFASPSMVHHCFDVKQSSIHFWFEGGAGPDLLKLEEATRKYALVQTEIFGELPVKDYHFLYLLLNQKFRHGVEHMNSTVIAMGPAEGFAENDFYNDFLAISSHELFHLWNVKRMRPEEMLPYDFTKENYSRLGYIYEGVTTYYGDLMLWRSGVWSFEEYAKSLAGDLDRHVNNSGRFNYSLAESSYDTWLDGYVAGVNGRKVSIYIEGLVAALVADVMIMEATNCRANLDTVLGKLYEKSFKNGKGYTEEMYQGVLEEISGISFKTYFEELIHGKGSWEMHLKKSFEKLGIELLVSENEDLTLKCVVAKVNNMNDSQRRLFEFWRKSS